MSEHVHEWDFIDAYGEVEAIFCRICDKTLSNDEAKALMNAAERLTAEDAKVVAADCDELGFMDEEWLQEYLPEWCNLRDYAEARGE